jgi:hypothetical protein
MMQGAAEVPIREQIKRVRRDLAAGTRQPTVAAAGSLDGYSLYESDYLGLSAVPSYVPEDVPPDAERVTANRPSTPPRMISIPLEIIAEP